MCARALQNVDVLDVLRVRDLFGEGLERPHSQPAVEETQTGDRPLRHHWRLPNCGACLQRGLDGLVVPAPFFKRQRFHGDLG